MQPAQTGGARHRCQFRCRLIRDTINQWKSVNGMPGGHSNELYYAPVTCALAPHVTTERREAVGAELREPAQR
jgi:hypothetical protein